MRTSTSGWRRSGRRSPRSDEGARPAPPDCARRRQLVRRRGDLGRRADSRPRRLPLLRRSEQARSPRTRTARSTTSPASSTRAQRARCRTRSGPPRSSSATPTGRASSGRSRTGSSSAGRPRGGARPPSRDGYVPASRATNRDVITPATATGAPRRTTETGRNVSGEKYPGLETTKAAAAETRHPTMKRLAK